MCHRLQLALPGSVPSVGKARRAAVVAAGDWGMASPDRDVLALVVSELVTNAIQAASAGVELGLAMHHDRVDVSVADDAGGEPASERAPPDATSGRGLAIVARLSEGWGVRPLPPGGKVVWALLGLAPPCPGEDRHCSCTGCSCRTGRA